MTIIKLEINQRLFTTFDIARDEEKKVQVIINYHNEQINMNRILCVYQDLNNKDVKWARNYDEFNSLVDKYSSISLSCMGDFFSLIRATFSGTMSTAVT